MNATELLLEYEPDLLKHWEEETSQNIQALKVLVIAKMKMYWSKLKPCSDQICRIFNKKKKTNYIYSIKIES